MSVTSSIRASSRARAAVPALFLCASLVMLVAGVGVLGARPVAAADSAAPSGPRLQVDRVDATGEAAVIEGFALDSSAEALTVQSDGATLPTRPKDTPANDVVVVIDNSADLTNAEVQLAKQSVAPLLASADRLGVVSTGGGAEVLTGPTGRPGAVQAALEGIAPSGVSATWSGVARAAELLESSPENTTRTVVLIAGAADASAAGALASARSALERSGSRLDVVLLPLGIDVGAADALVEEVGGTSQVLGSDEEFAGALETVAHQLDARFAVAVPVEAESDLVPLTVGDGTTTADIVYTQGAVRSGSIDLAPATESGSGLMASPLVKWLAVLMGLAAGFMLVWSVATMVVPDRDGVVSRLEAYEEPLFESQDQFSEAVQSHTTIPMIARAVELTGEIAERRGVLEKVETMLERANLPLRAPEAMFFTAALGALGVAMAYFLTGSLLIGLICAILAVLLPPAILNFRIGRRRKAFVAQLPDTLTMLSSTLRAGYSISQGFEAISREVSEPMARELQRVVTESRLGRPLEESLEAAAERMDSEDFGWAVLAIRIQREVGGNLAELLLTVADTMTQRERLRRDVSTLTAEGRMSAIVIGLLPPGLAAVLFVVNREYVSVLFEPGIGYTLVGAALLMMAIGFAWMKKTITIEV